MSLLTLGREPVSGYTHLVGAFFGIGGLITLLVLGALRGTAMHQVAFAVYGVTLVGMFAASALYHLARLSPVGVRRLRRLDHSAIFLFIAGSYTPFCMLALWGSGGAALLAVVWFMAAVGVGVKLFWLDAPRWATITPYLVMGWSVMACMPSLIAALPTAGLAWLVAGGLAYSLGALIYALKRPDPWPGFFGFHEVWHLFVLAGAFCHWWAVSGYLV